MEIKDLWIMSSEEFNNWRRENDLSQLLIFFKEYLPFFEEWQKDNGVSDKYFLLSDSTSKFFIGKGELALYHFEDKWGNSGTPTYIGTYNSYLNSKKLWIDRGSTEDIKYKLYTKFIPYFYWLKKIKKTTDFKLKNDPNNTFISDLTYRGWEGRFGISRAKLLGNFKVLKLGTLSIKRDMMLNKNLDFVDIDDLIIEGGYGNRYSDLVYSSCRNIKIINSDFAFLNFKKSYISNFQILNSKIQDLHFSDTYGEGISIIENVKIRNISFNNTCPIGKITDLNRVNITNLQYDLKNIGYVTKKDFFRVIRVAFQQFGYMHKVQDFFYLERVNLMLSYLNIKNSNYNFPPIYKFPIGDLIYKIKIGYPGYTIKNIIKLTLISFKSYLKILLFPRLLFNYMKFKLKFLWDFLSYLVWGFGEKPLRIIFSIFFLILVFGLYYQKFSGISALEYSLMESLKYSAFVFTTIGYGDFSNLGNINTAIAIESILGIIFSGLFIATLVNKVRY